MAERTPLHEQTRMAGALFIEEAGYEVPAQFGNVAAEYDAARTSAVLVDQSSRGKIEVQGADAARFLHNLTTNDILQLAPGQGCEAFLTTTKAKVIAYLLLYRHATPVQPPGFSLDVAPGTADRLIQHLDRYLISEQVEFQNYTAAYAQMHLAGPQAGQVLERVLGAGWASFQRLQHGRLPEKAGLSGWVRCHDALGVPGYDLVCPAEDAGKLWQRLMEAGARPAGSEACEILRIEAGMPRESAELDENTFAPEVGRSAETISYTKGCYLGQESIVMARDRGQINRTLVGVRLGSTPVPRDTRLLVGDKEVGRVTSSVLSPRLGAAIGLAYVRRGHQAPGSKLEAMVADTRLPVEVIRLPIDETRGGGSVAVEKQA